MATFEDRAVGELGRRLAKIYNEAQKGMTEKVNSFFANFEKLDEKKKKLVEAGKLTEQEYKTWKKNKLLMGEKYMDLRDSIADNMLHANERAAAIINHELPNVYAHNYNQVGEGVERKMKGYSFDLTNPETVRKLATDRTTLLPYKFVDGHRDTRWNSTKVNAQILQGILQGESADQMAQRLMNISVMNQESALRNARTAVTSAQNKGRIDAMRQCEDDGVIMGKEWIATKDERTREAHLELDRVVVKVNEPFENSIGQIMYPGDPDADPANTYNCRCTIAEVVLGFKPKEEVNSENVEEEIKEQHVVAEGKDITDTWKRREDQFDFEIEDVINAQGFDGTPQVVDADEFDKAVQESNFVAQRTYSAPDQETLDAYRQQLYEGKWYVDCSVGESHYGQGMYCTANEGQTISDSIRNTMNKYIEINFDRITDYGDLQIDVKSAVETFTMTPDAKFINYDDLRKLKEKEITKLSSSGDYNKMNEIFNMDNGSYATMKGYDGITGVYNFVSKDNDDVIILNRTKVIFRRPK